MRVVEDFRRRGWVVARGFFAPDPLRAEIVTALEAGARGRFRAPVGDEAIVGAFVPMMAAYTPHSLALLLRLEPIARELLGGPVLPVRAKGVRYHGSAPWHRDSERDLASVGSLAYLEPTTADTGALRIRGRDGVEAVLATEPGDLIFMDERLEHGSSGGRERLQWRADHVADAPGALALFEDVFSGAWSGLYDAQRYPSYGAGWRASGHPAVERLEVLGVHALAAAHESEEEQGRDTQPVQQHHEGAADPHPDPQ